MPFIEREDGERFVIPSYREVITAKNTGVLKKEINLLSKNYGQYITLQRRGPIQYEIAFSPDTGYLLGETVWHELKRPLDLIYCEAIPNSTDAILVIVKDGGVYLDGRFPQESIPEELVVFLTQKNNFDIYVYGDVPISQTAEVGKFSFETSAVRSFTVLDKPLFPTLPRLKIFQLQPIDQVLKLYGIGVFPAKKAAIAGAIFVILGFMWFYMTAPKEVVTEIIISQVNPYVDYVQALTSPAPEDEMQAFLDKLPLVLSMPGWNASAIKYDQGKLSVSAKSSGTNIAVLRSWADQNKARIALAANGITLSLDANNVKMRPAPTKIYKIESVLLSFIDQLAAVYPGNHLKFTPGKKRSASFRRDKIEISLSDVSPGVLALIGKQLAGFPFILDSISLSVNDGLLNGTINLEILGN